MEYDNPQFIDAVKKILRDGVAQVADSLKDLKDSVNAHWEADEKRYETKQVSVTDLRTDVPIQVQTEPKRSKPENVWRYIIGTLEAAAFIAIVVYTIVAYHQWQEMMRANDVSMSNFRRARIDANDQLKQAIIATGAAKESAGVARDTLIASDRPWIALDNSSGEPIVFEEPLEVEPPGFFRNISKTNAEIMRVLSSDNVNAVYAKFALLYTIKNSGHSPANVRLNTKVVEGYPRAKRLLEVIRAENVCEQLPNDWPWTIVPGGNKGYHRIDRLDIKDAIDNPKATIRPTVIGCIQYRSTLENQTIHTARFVGQVSMAVNERGEKVHETNPIPIPVPKFPIPPKDLKIVDVWMIGKAD